MRNVAAGFRHLLNLALGLLLDNPNPQEDVYFETPVTRLYNNGSFEVEDSRGASLLLSELPKFSPHCWGTAIHQS